MADKDVRHQWDTDVIGPAARGRDIRRDAIYRDYWVKGTDGEWYRVPREDWEAAQIGQALRLRPGDRERLTPPTLGPCLTPDGRWQC